MMLDLARWHTASVSPDAVARWCGTLFWEASLDGDDPPLLHMAALAGGYLLDQISDPEVVLEGVARAVGAVVSAALSRKELSWEDVAQTPSGTLTVRRRGFAPNIYNLLDALRLLDEARN